MGAMIERYIWRGWIIKWYLTTFECQKMDVGADTRMSSDAMYLYIYIYIYIIVPRAVNWYWCFILSSELVLVTLYCIGIGNELVAIIYCGDTVIKFCWNTLHDAISTDTYFINIWHRSLQCYSHHVLRSGASTFHSWLSA